MEGPSIHLAAAQLHPFAGQSIDRVRGNSTIGIDRLHGERVKDIFAWGKHLVFQLDSFALRVHFMLWGTYAATVDGVSVTGDYRRAGVPRLTMEFRNGETTIWSASLRFLETAHARAEYDFTADVLSDTWDPKAALVKMRRFPDAEIADVLLDQSIFGGVGNIIKNEVLFRTRTSPFARISALPLPTLKRIVADARTFSLRFLELRRAFVLRKNLEIYGRSVCPSCAGKVTRRIHGTRLRRSFFCRVCQDVRVPRGPSETRRRATARKKKVAPKSGPRHSRATRRK